MSGLFLYREKKNSITVGENYFQKTMSGVQNDLKVYVETENTSTLLIN